MGQKVTITRFEEYIDGQTGNDKVVVEWSFNPSITIKEKNVSNTVGVSSNTSGYTIVWVYKDDHLIEHRSETTNSGYANRSAEFSLPYRTVCVTVYIMPNSSSYPHYNYEKTKEAVKYTSGPKRGQIKTPAKYGWVEKGTKSFYTGEWVSQYKELDGAYIPAKADAPSASIEKGTNKIITSVSSQDPNTQEIEFSLWVNNTVGPINSKTVFAISGYYSCEFDVSGLNTNADYYSIRARGVHMSTLFGLYSDFSSPVYPLPNPPTNVKATPFGDSGESIKVTWDKVPTATDYEIQYARLLDSLNAGNGSSASSDTNYVLLEGLGSGSIFYIRVRSNNNRGSDRYSGWSNPISCILGKQPDPPFTYAYKNRIKTSEDAELYWVHSSRDSSLETWYQIKINDNPLPPQQDTRSDEEKKEAMHYSYKHGLKAGGEFTWAVRTKGILGSDSPTSDVGWSEYSTIKTIKVYDPPTCSISVKNVDTYPLEFDITCGPTTQNIMSYDVNIVNIDPRYTHNNAGDTEYLATGQVLYRKQGYGKDFINNGSSYTSTISIEAKDVDVLLEDGTYSIVFTVYMNTGLSGEAERKFTTKFKNLECVIDAQLSISAQPPITCYITPYANDDNGNRLNNVLLSVYRKELDGTITPIKENFSNTQYLTLTDSHVNLDYARYRIVAKDIINGGIKVYNLPDTPIFDNNIIIQWAEESIDFDGSVEGDDNLSGMYQWNGKYIAIPTNIDISNSYGMDTNLVEYIGRKHPVGYYGTQLGETSTWSVEIPKYDTVTLNTIRELGVYRGDVYVREPGGTGYWAHVVPSFSVNHKALTIPISFSITRVEGE